MKVPRLPLGYRRVGLRTLEISEDTRIWQLLKEAGARTPAADDDEDDIFKTEGFFAHLDADIARVVSTYLTARYFELCDPSLSHFREDLERVRDALDRMPPVTSPVWPAIEARAGEGATETIAAFRLAVQELCGEGGIGRRTGAPAKRAERQLITQLARLFEIYTGRVPRPGSRVFSTFEDFVGELDRQAQRWLRPRVRDNVEYYQFADGVEKRLRKT